MRETVSLGTLTTLRRSRILVLAALLLASRGESAGSSVGDAWPVVGGDSGGSRYSALADIDRTNVGRLRVAWTHHHGDFRAGWPSELQGTSFEATPILVEGFLVFNTPFSRVVALDPATGAERWSFDPEIDRGRRFHSAMANRGVAYWRDAESDGPCASRIFLGALDGRLIALDLRTGEPCASFGREGTVDLLVGIEPLVDAWEYNLTSPPTLVGDVVVVGSSISDQVRRVQPPGAVRGYDARSGRLVWRFDTIPRGGESGVETWPREGWREAGGANVWGIMTADLARGLVFLPVSAAGPDFYGGDRPGENLFSNSVVALDAKTGKRIWHFQTVHHDLWDYDLAAPPNLVRLKRDEREIDAVAQATKTGFVFLLDRDTGAPLFPVEERPVPASDVPGEVAWPTQPFPTRPPPLVPQRLTEGDLRAEDSRRLERCRATLRSLRNEGIFTPPSERGTLAYPWPWGGATWAGGAFDPETGVLYVPTNNAAAVVRLKKLAPGNFEKRGGLMLQSLFNLAWWRFTGEAPGLRYAMSAEPFYEGGLPCNRPPWGMLSAVDLGKGEILWQVPVGETEDGIRGTVNFGPPLVTAGGLVFQGGGLDSRFRAHDARTGEVLATFELPAGLHAGPMTYRLEGRQYLVVAPGGHVRLGSKLGDAVIAYTLP